jgi:hypothetical protein
MEKYAYELEFISRISKDGSEIEKITQEHLEYLENNKFANREKFIINVLSISQGTYIASGTLSYVVKIKTQEKGKVPDGYKSVDRIEIINHSAGGAGREYVRRNVSIDDFSLQDNGKTLKIFLK